MLLSLDEQKQIILHHDLLKNPNDWPTLNQIEKFFVSEKKKADYITFQT